MIFDKIRKKNIILQPEEKVRQWLINYFIEELEYPRSLFSIEKKIVNSSTKKYRSDILIYDKEIHPFILIECKSQQVNITEETLKQLLNYNKFIEAKYIIISNKIKTYCWGFDKVKNKYFPANIPKYCEIKNLL